MAVPPRLRPLPHERDLSHRRGGVPGHPRGRRPPHRRGVPLQAPRPPVRRRGRPARRPNRWPPGLSSHPPVRGTRRDHLDPGVGDLHEGETARPRHLQRKDDRHDPRHGGLPRHGARRQPRPPPHQSVPRRQAPGAQREDGQAGAHRGGGRSAGVDRGRLSSRRRRRGHHLHAPRDGPALGRDHRAPPLRRQHRPANHRRLAGRQGRRAPAPVRRLTRGQVRERVPHPVVPGGDPGHPRPPHEGEGAARPPLPAARGATYWRNAHFNTARWKRVKARAAESGLTKDPHPHSLRHSHVSHLLPHHTIAAISKRIGHGAGAITMDLYGHLTTEADGAMAATAGAILTGRRRRTALPPASPEEALQAVYAACLAAHHAGAGLRAIHEAVQRAQAEALAALPAGAA
ncbi:tyrosine-type recombinase/integrase [Streptomyces virginiae]|uniref:tyrosine-type recombinase/integrase n=1 Tax=Streptomyces virginiae TaxID=1961 RepID=UPI0037220CD6